MTVNNEGTPAPESEEAKQALAELEKEGHDISGKTTENVDDGEITDKKPEEVATTETPEEKAVRETKEKEEANVAAGLNPDGTPKTESKVARTPTMVEAYKLKIAEDQKDAALQKAADLEAEIKRLSTQDRPVSETQKDNLEEEIKKLAEETGYDSDVITRLAGVIEKVLTPKLKPSGDLEKTLKELKDKEQLAQELSDFSKEFEKDVAPLLKDHNLSGEALSQLKDKLKDFAFSETYAKVPLKEIFHIKEASLGLKESKRSSESKGQRIRSNDVVDFDNMTDEQFANLTPEQVEKFEAHKRGDSWKR